MSFVDSDLHKWAAISETDPCRLRKSFSVKIIFSADTQLVRCTSAIATARHLEKNHFLRKICEAYKGRFR